MFKTRLALCFILLFLAGCSFGNRLTVPEKNSQEIREGIEYFTKSNYLRARSVFTHFIETHIGVPELEEAQWYLIQISEKLDPVKIAIYQYNLFLKNFPGGRHFQEALERLAALGTQDQTPVIPPDSAAPPFEPAPAPPKMDLAVSAPRAPRITPDKIYGNLITEYLYDEVLSPSPAMNIQSRLSEFLDIRWRKGMGPDLRTYFNAMNGNDFINSNNNRERLNKLYIEGNRIGVLANFKFGRQPSSGNTLFNRFDGLSFSFPFSAILWTTSAGVPVDIFAHNNINVSTDQRFYESYLSVNNFHSFTAKAYFTQDFFQDFSIRKAFGTNGFFLKDNVNAGWSFDQDIDFNRVNSSMVNFEYTRSKMRYSGSIEFRKNPFLTFQTALLDPSLVSTSPMTMANLIQIMPREQIQQLAEANTQTTMDYNLGLAAELSEAWRAELRFGLTLFNPRDVLAHGPWTDSDKTMTRYSLFISERNAMSLSETGTVLLLYQFGTDSTDITAIGTLSRNWTNGFQGTARFRIESMTFNVSDTDITRWAPGFVARHVTKRGTEISLEGDYTVETNSLLRNATQTIQSRASVMIPF
ncbi:MAG TPA: hypothetical protein VN944_10730 [Nitrospiria bacterium]|nr:hypothetical protein [Nitrospiria bacterium]